MTQRPLIRYTWLALSLVLNIVMSTGRSSDAFDEYCEPFNANTPSAEPGKDNLFIGRITIRTADLFDLNNPSQGLFIHSAANSLHIVTRENTVFDALTFRTGDPYSAEILAEGERTLRQKRYLRDASVVAHQVCGNRVDVEVRTIDNWTLTPSISFGSSGGVNSYSFEVQDLNVLGLGKELKLRNAHKGDTREATFVYRDDNVLGGRHSLRLELGDNDEGELYSIQAGLPFYSNKAQKSWLLSLSSETLGFDSPADEQVLIPVKTETATLSFAKRLDASTLPYARVGTGLRFSRQLTELPTFDTGIEASYDFEEFYPFITAHWSASKWAKRQNYEGLRGNEDIDLGLTVDLEAGLLLNALGSERDAVRLGIEMSNGWYSSNLALHKVRYRQIQYFDSEEESEYEISAHYQYFRWLNDTDQLDLHLTGETHRGFSPVYSFSVGGADGLRAYPNEFQSGEQRVIGVAEYRHITNWSPFSLAHTAVTSFVEAGQAWTDGDNVDTLSNVGFGLLVSPTRSSRAAINRFDISFPLVNGEGVNDFQIFIGTRINL